MFTNISLLPTIQFYQHSSFTDSSVLLTFQLYWHFSFTNISVFLTFQFYQHFRFTEISVLLIYHFSFTDKSFQFYLHFNLTKISVLPTFQFYQNFNFTDISVLLTFQFHQHFSFADILVLSPSQPVDTENILTKPQSPSTTETPVDTIISFFPPWLQRNPRVTIKLTHMSTFSKGFLTVSQNKSFWIFLEGRTRKTATKYILSVQQLTELLNNGHLLQGTSHLITKTNIPPLEP